MIPPYVLSLLVWAAIAGWSITATAIWFEYQWRQRKRLRTAELRGRLTAAGAALADVSPRVTGTGFQDLLSAGVPKAVASAVAQGLRARMGDHALTDVASGRVRASIDARIQALQILAAGLHPEMHATLAGALRDSNVEVAAVALRLLRGLDDEPAGRALVQALADGVYSHSRVAAALHQMTVNLDPLLGPLLAHPEETVRFWGLLLVGRTTTSQWSEVVRRLAADPAPAVRRAAVEALGRVGKPDDRARLIARFFDPSPVVRLHAARASTAFGDATVADALVMLLPDREWVVRAAARDALRALGDVAAPAVTRTLWHRDPFAANNAAEVLFLTGEAVALVHACLAHPDDPARRRLVARLLEVSGPHIVRAIHDGLDTPERAALQQFMTEGAAAPARRRSR